MKNEFLRSLQRLKRDLDGGLISPDEYVQQRQKVLDCALSDDVKFTEQSESETQSDLFGLAEDTVWEMLETPPDTKATDEPKLVDDNLKSTTPESDYGPDEASVPATPTIESAPEPDASPNRLNILVGITATAGVAIALIWALQ